MAELLAFGSLLAEGFPVRLSGQDSIRGTFSQRHAAWFDTETQEIYIPLNHIREEQERFCVYNSMLSEAAVLGFDYGYSLVDPDILVIWEAQFGDFANGAQVIIDQFITAALDKWQRGSGLVMLLPHGYEGQGPEHSNAYLERYLTLCAEDNIQVCNLTTPAQYFHVLRRQLARRLRRPLVIMSPKSLLRHRRAVSPVDELVSGRFHEVLDDPSPPARPRRLALCSGKIFYDLVEGREAAGIDDVAIVRVEQLYPFNSTMFRRDHRTLPGGRGRGVGPGGDQEPRGVELHAAHPAGAFPGPRDRLCGPRAERQPGHRLPARAPQAADRRGGRSARRPEVRAAPPKTRPGFDMMPVQRPCRAVLRPPAPSHCGDLARP